MNIFLFLNWWYGPGWEWLFSGYKFYIKKIARSFSIAIILRTMFLPWKQLSIKITIHNFLQAVIDNTVSRAIGFIVRLSVLLVAVILFVVVTVAYCLFFALWPLLPLGVIILPILSILGAKNG